MTTTKQSSTTINDNIRYCGCEYRTMSHVEDGFAPAFEAASLNSVGHGLYSTMFWTADGTPWHGSVDVHGVSDVSVHAGRSYVTISIVTGNGIRHAITLDIIAEQLADALQQGMVSSSEVRS